MAGIFKSIGYNLARIAKPAGRETRALFWPYAIAVVVTRIVVAIALVVPVMVDMMDRIMAYIRVHPEGLPKPVPGAPPSFPPELMPHMEGLVVPGMIVSAVTILLLFTAAVRRLHDRGRTGWWAALPLPFELIALASAPYALRHLTDFASNPRFAPLMTLNSLASWLALIVLIVLLVGESESGPNRFGPDPRERPAEG
jgi:uncharacterized membrane protein YhaH (DUF805 family)